ncbi:hypothetical protein [Rhizobium sp. K102]|uniref:hypothetical protein n=1 Tax=Rhizobium sp. K102 TaxID=2918527 RepID=UPI001EFAF04A|nr:hypothetical protein [Rhizobium sp. K102]ULR44922.1 hypothetical protein MHI61_06735 [Rhizobium sp. K102]
MISNRQQSLVSFYQAADLFYCCRPVTSLVRDPGDLLCGRGVCQEGGQSGNRHLDTLLQDAARNTDAFALHGAELKQYIFAFVRQWPMQARKQAMAIALPPQALSRQLPRKAV